jgi:hypothetical protein
MAGNALASLFPRGGWNFDVADARNFLMPVQQGIDAGVADYQRGLENERQNKLMQLQQDRFGLEKGRDQRAAQQFQREQTERDQTFPLELERSRAQLAQTQAQTATSQAQLGQIRMQTPEARAQIAGQYGLKAGTQEYNAFVLNGTFTPQNPVDVAVEGLIKQSLPSQVTQPQPRYQPQSFESPNTQQGDPNLIRVQDGPKPQTQAPDAGSMFSGMNPEQKRRTGEALLLNPRTKALGEQLLKDVDRDKLGTEAANENDKKELKAYDGLAKIKQIRSSFDPSFLTYGKQGAMAWASLVSKVGTLRPEQQQELYRYATFRRDSAANANAAIKDQSGATVTPQELQRNNVELPNAGSGIFDGDDPVTFKAKLDRAEEVLALGVARTRYLRQQGFKGDLNQMSNALPVEAMRDLINRRAASIEAEIKSQRPDLPSNIVDREVDARVKREFGI